MRWHRAKAMAKAPQNGDAKDGRLTELTIIIISLSTWKYTNGTLRRGRGRERTPHCCQHRHQTAATRSRGAPVSSVGTGEAQFRSGGGALRLLHERDNEDCCLIEVGRNLLHRLVVLRLVLGAILWLAQLSEFVQSPLQARVQALERTRDSGGCGWTWGGLGMVGWQDGEGWDERPSMMAHVAGACV